MRTATTEFRPVASMRGWLFATMAFATLALFASDAWAKTFSIGKVSKDSMMRSCKSAGGTPIGLNGGYGCVRYNCDGKGNGCAVHCNRTGCYGHTPISSPKGKVVGDVLGKQPQATVMRNPPAPSNPKVGQLRPIASAVVKPAQTFQPMSKKTFQPQTFSGADRGAKNEGRGSRR